VVLVSLVAAFPGHWCPGMEALGTKEED